MASHQTARTMALLQHEEQVGQLRMLKLAVQAGQAATPDELAKLIDAEIRKQKKAKDRLMELLDWADLQNQNDERSQ